MSQNINKKTNRNSSIELLRIIAMLMIVFFQFADHGGLFLRVEALHYHFYGAILLDWVEKLALMFLC